MKRSEKSVWPRYPTVVSISATKFIRVERTTLVRRSFKPHMGTKLYGRDLKDYDEVDVESLLSKLSPNELEELNNEVDPDNTLLPPSQRCREQTDKSPTGPFKRDHLIKFLEEKAKQEHDWEEKVPFKSGLKRGKLWAPKIPQITCDQLGGDMPIELDLDDDDDEVTTALKQTSETDLVDLAGILGMHSMLSQQQYYNALKGKPQELENATFHGVVKAAACKILPDEPPNPTDPEDVISRLKQKDSTLEELNLNNMKNISRERIKIIVEAAFENPHLRTFSLANVAMKDEDALPICSLLERNPALKCLNVESNFLTGEMLAKLLQSTLKLRSLVEFRAENQRLAVLGNKVEMDLMNSVEQHPSLLRVGIAFQSMEARHRVADALERNYERLRLRRIGIDPDADDT